MNHSFTNGTEVINKSLLFLLNFNVPKNAITIDKNKLRFEKIII